MFPLFESSDAMLAVILCIVACAFWVQKFKIFKMIGPALFVIIAGVLLVNLRIVPAYTDVYGVISTYCIPFSVSLYLLNVDLKQIMKMSKQPLISIVSAVFCVSIVAVVFGAIFGNIVEEGWKVAGMFVGTYTGGSANLTAIASGLDASASTIAAANAADYVIGMPTLVLMFAMPALLKKNGNGFRNSGLILLQKKSWKVMEPARGLWKQKYGVLRRLPSFLRFPFPLWVLPQSSPVM